jgi:hypothetical protein
MKKRLKKLLPTAKLAVKINETRPLIQSGETEKGENGGPRTGETLYR